ncbi:MAG: MMPL family transporter [Thermoleophilaceae bacterium]
MARPKLVLGAWSVATLLLAGLGIGVEGQLHRQDLVVPGAPSAKAGELARRHFGDSQNLVVMLEGPSGRLGTTTHRVAARLDALPHTDTIGPWAPGADKRLHPSPTRTVVLVRVDEPFEPASQEAAPRIRKLVAATVRAPVHGYVTGYADVAAGIDRESIAAMKRAELIAAPLLLIVLLLVFRSPVAAALPLVLGQTTIAAGRGLIGLLNHAWSLDVVSLNMASMMGLALGVDYSLVLVSRFREELAAGQSTRDAARTATRTAGRTIVFAGLALGCAMVAANFVAPGGILFSSGVGVTTSVVLSVAGAAIALPAVLVLLGPRVNKWSFARRGAGRGWSSLVLRAGARPALAGGLVILLLALLASPALGLAMGPPDPRALPTSSPERRDFDKIAGTLGGGWSATYDITVVARHGRITDPRRLRALGDWQRQIAGEPRVHGVFGPAPIADRMQRLQRVAATLKSAGHQLARAKHDQRRLGAGLAQVGDGVGQMQHGLAAAASGAQALASGADKGGAGAQRLRAGLTQAASGAQRLEAGLAAADSGAKTLDAGAARLARGSSKLESGLRSAAAQTQASLPQVDRLHSGLAQGSHDLSDLQAPAANATAAVADAEKALESMRVGVADPQYTNALRAVLRAKGYLTGHDPVTGRQVDPRYPGMHEALGQASAGIAQAADGVVKLQQGSQRLSAALRRLANGAHSLHAGIARLEDGTRRLLAGIRRLKGGGGALTGGLSRLRSGGDALAAGAGQLAGGADRLAGGLSGGAHKVTRLASGVGRMRAGVAASSKRTAALTKGFGGGGAIQTGLFQSGYLPLAALDSAPHAARTGATFAVNLDRGGDAAHIVVMRAGDPTKTNDPVRKRLEDDSARFGRAHDAEVAVGGPATLLQDFHIEASSRLWWLVLALAASTYLVLVPVLRSVLLPLLAVLLNIGTVFAAFGVLSLGFTGSAPLGGPGTVDAIMVLAIFGIVFGLSIDYEVFLLARMREGYLLTGTTDGAIEYGLRHTAAVITGAALIMTGVFAAFALSDITSMRELGIGLAVAVLLDATVVRLVLLPAVIRLADGACWWLPRPLGRLLGEERVEAEAEPRSRAAFEKFGAFADGGDEEATGVGDAEIRIGSDMQAENGSRHAKAR